MAATVVVAAYCVVVLIAAVEISSYPSGHVSVVLATIPDVMGSTLDAFELVLGTAVLM